MADAVSLSINGQMLRVPAGSTVAAAVLLSGVTTFRRSVTGEARAPLCGMGICYECRVTVNGKPEPGMAERWDVSEDRKKYVFHLRDGKPW